MRVFIKNKLVSIGGSSEVLDEQQKPIFKVEGKIFSPRKKKLMYDTNGQLLYTIRNRYFNFFAWKTFIFDTDKNKVATIKRNKWSFKANYQILDCVDTMEITGKIFSFTSNIMRNGVEIGKIIRDFTIIKDSFTLEATDEKDIPFLTALVIGFDNLRDMMKKD